MSYDANGYPEVQTPDLKPVFGAIEDSNCIPFFGAGASMGYSFNGVSAPGIPGGWELTLELLRRAQIADEAQIAALNDPNSTADDLKNAMRLMSYDLPKAAEAFLYSRAGHRTELDSFLRKQVSMAAGPRPIHTVIAQIQDIYTVLTTNYDCLFEEACDTHGRELFKHVHEQFKTDTGNWRCRANLAKPQLIYHKMHGCKDRDESMIITRADYIRYLANCQNPAKGMPTCVSNRLPCSTLLFLGYGLNDWDLLTIWEGVVASLPRGGNETQSFAVMKSVSPEHRQFLEKRDIKPIECDLTVFAIALARKFKLALPQLGIPRPGGAQ